MAQTIHADITPGAIGAILNFSQNDVGREFAIVVDSFSIPDGATVKIQATKPSGFGFSVAGTVSGSKVSFQTTEEMSDEAGRFPAELQITKDGLLIGTANFIINSEPNPHPDGTTDGMAERAIPILTVLVRRIEAAAESIHELTVQAQTLEPGQRATAIYNEEDNEIKFGIPRGSQMAASDDGNGNITLSFS